jgi:hypothetical protein
MKRYRSIIALLFFFPLMGHLIPFTKNILKRNKLFRHSGSYFIFEKQKTEKI